MTGNARMFNSINTNDSNGYDSIIFGDKGKGKVKGLSKIAISNDLSISNVLLVECLKFNLLSMAQLCDLGFKCIFGVNDVEIINVDGSNLILKALDMRIYTWLILMLVMLNLSTCLFTKSSMGWLWHRGLGHVGMKQLNRLIKHDLVRGLKDVVFEKDKLYSSYQANKQVGNTHPKKSMMSTSKAFELLHMNLFGPMKYTSIGGNKYGFVIVDDYTRYTWIFFLVDKSDVFATLNHLSRAFTMSLK
jgi:hypothetical protein